MSPSNHRLRARDFLSNLPNNRQILLDPLDGKQITVAFWKRISSLLQVFNGFCFHRRNRSQIKNNEIVFNLYRFNSFISMVHSHLSGVFHNFLQCVPLTNILVLEPKFKISTANISTSSVFSMEVSQR